MKLLTGLFRAARKRLLTTDNDMGAFRAQLGELVESKDSLDEAAIGEKIEALKKICEDLPEGDEKAKLLRFLEDFKNVKEQDAAVAKEAAGAVADLFEKLDKEAMKDAPAVEAADEDGTTEGEKNPAVETKDEGENAPAPKAETTDEDENADKVVEQTEEPKVDGTKDEDPDAQYTLEEIYQFIKKRMAEDAACGEETTDADGETKKEDQAQIVGDSAPVIPVTINNTMKGGLNDLFSMMKKGE